MQPGPMLLSIEDLSNDFLSFLKTFSSFDEKGKLSVTKCGWNSLVLVH